MFEKLLSAHPDIKARLEISQMGAFVSDRFLIQLYNIIEFNSTPSTLLEKLNALVDTNKFRLEKIRWELARIPTQLIVVKQQRNNYYGRTEKFIGLRTPDSSHTFSKESPYYPDAVHDVDQKKNGQTVWCLCSQEQARALQCKITPCWSETDSLVDWIKQSVHPTQKNTDTQQTPQRTETETERPTDTQQTPKQLIYRYIQTHAPVKTADILQQKIASRSRVFAILKNLEREGKIQKADHGVYKPL